jgi:hypothetical protein
MNYDFARVSAAALSVWMKDWPWRTLHSGPVERPEHQAVAGLRMMFGKDGLEVRHQSAYRRSG